MRQNSVLRKIPIARRDINNWPHVDADALPKDERTAFLRRKKALTGLLSEASYEEIEKETGLCASDVRRLLSKCIQPDGDGDICGERALVPYVHTRPYCRRKQIVRTVKSGRGYCSGGLNQLFDEYPEIEERLVQEVLRQLPAGDKVPEAKISVRNLHKVFLDLCKKIGRDAQDDWPFNTKTKGLTPLAIFIKQIAQKKPEKFVRARYGADSATRLSVGSGKDRLLVPQMPFDVVGLDEFSFDAFSTITIPVLYGGEQDIAVERIHVVVLIEFLSKAICGWHIFFTASAATSDIRQVIQNALTPWKPWQFSIPGLTYGAPDAGMPSGLITGLEYHSWAILMVDNALAHQDISLLDDLGSVTGSFVNFGPVGAWYRRADLERRILDVLMNSAQRLPSTSGSAPCDPVKNDPIGIAVKLKIRWTEIQQLIEVVIAQLNAMPSEGLGMLSSIELLRQKMSDPLFPFLRRTLPLARHTPNCLTMVYQEAVVKGSQKNGRRPYINLDRGRYTNPTLAQSWGLIGKKLRIGIDENEFRQVEASVVGSGAVIGTLYVQGGWSKTRHTRAMRKAINQLRYLKILTIPPDADPVAIYLQYLGVKARVEAKPKAGQHKVSKSANKLAAIEHRTGLSLSDTIQTKGGDCSSPPLLPDGASPLHTSLRDLLWHENKR